MSSQTITVALVYRAPVTQQEAQQAAEMISQLSTIDLKVALRDIDTDADIFETSGDHNDFVLGLLSVGQREGMTAKVQDLVAAVRMQVLEVEGTLAGQLVGEPARIHCSDIPDRPDISADLARLVEWVGFDPARPSSRAARRGRSAGHTHPGQTPHRISSPKRRR